MGKRRTGEYKECLICRSIFYVKRCEINKGKGKYCSFKCMGVSNLGHIPWNKGLKVGEKNGRPKKLWLPKPCLNCKKEFFSWPSDNKKYCSESCRSFFVSKRDGAPMKGKRVSFESKKKLSATLQGIKLSEWKGFISSQDKIERNKFRREIQKEVFARDNYTCQMCGDRGVDLQVDHIQPWAEYIELRFCIDNCRTLCAGCHYKITFGKPMPPTVRAWGHNFLREGLKNN